MKYTLNPNPIFEDFVIMKSLCSKENKHYINKSNEIVFNAYKKNLPYYDHIETNGLYSSLIYSYGADINKNFLESYHLVFPTFRKKINDTRGSFSIRIKEPIDILVNQKKYEEKLVNVVLNGFINIKTKVNDLIICRKIYCSNDFAATIIKYKIKNNSNEQINVKINNTSNIINCDDNILDKKYHVTLILSRDNTLKNNNEISYTLNPNESKKFHLIIKCDYDNEIYDEKFELHDNIRKDFIKNINNTYEVITNNNILNTMVKYSKIRACEAICLTKGGLMHSPGGGNYYAATWCNDQCEYTAPFFAYLDYNLGIKTMNNCFNHYIPYMYEDKKIPSSIIAEATSYWNGAGDRGDASMYAYGLSRYLLTLGDKDISKEFIKPIKWCIEYTLRRKNENGLYDSDTDELENRFESGRCNISTNAIFYQALLKTSILFNELGIENNYEEIAKELKDAINNYFYKDGKCIYCIEETHLRSHVSYPLLMGLFVHKDDIIKVLFDEKIFLGNGFKTIDNNDTFWDRVTLMAIRGLFNADYADIAYDLLCKYSNDRLLNDHVPYAIEAYPEGNQAQLSGESALYARIYLEGILGFEPMGLNKFKLHLSMPKELDYITIKNIKYNNKLFTINITKDNSKYNICINELNYFNSSSNYKDLIISI